MEYEIEDEIVAVCNVNYKMLYFLDDEVARCCAVMDNCY